MKLLLFLIGAVALLVSACAQATPTSEADTAGKSHQVISVGQLRTMMEKKDFLLVNVHIPYAGEIAGTDLFVPYNEVEQNLSKLPANKGTKIVVYCRSGQMSNIAARTLTGLGYTNIIDVDGGMIAWENAGYPLIQKPQ